MNRTIGSSILAGLLLLAGTAFGEETTANATAACNFDSTQQIAVQYQRITVDAKKKVFGKEVPYGKVWAPGEKPMTMFTNTPVTIGGKELPMGAYTLFLIPEEKAWTLVVSKSTDTSGKYDEGQDLARIPMQYGELSSPESEFTVYFAHVAPDQCNMRLDLQKARAWVAITKKK